jgi:hypothetical protein
MNSKISHSRIKFSQFLIGLLVTCWTLNSSADSLVGAGQEVSGEIRRGPKGISEPTQVFDVDTATGERSNIQYFSQRGIASLMAMDRDSEGTLWGIHEPNRLVTIDETTGLVTDVVELTDEFGGFLRFPAIAFVPGSEVGDPDSLFAIAKVEDIRLPAPLKVVDYDGFVLVEVDVETGLVTPFGPGIGGQYENNGAAHGLEYDPTFGLIHLWNVNDYEFSPEDKSVSGPGGHIELIDPATGASIHVPAEYDTMTYPEKSDSGELPSGFQAIAHADGAGMIYVYENNGPEPELFLVQILDNGMDGPTYVSSYVSTFQSGHMYYNPQVRAMERSSDGGALVIDAEGILEFYVPGPPLGFPEDESADKGMSVSGIHVLDNEVETSIGGYAPEFRSMATDPISGLIFALSGQPDSRPKSATNKDPFEDEEPYNGLYVIDRNGPAEIELLDFDIPIIDPEEYEAFEKGLNSPLTEVAAIAFDDRGVLYGISYNGYLVTIDLTTGIVTEVDESFSDNIVNPGDLQLEFNPEDGRLYVLYFSYEYYELVFASFARNGSDFTEIPLPEEASELDADSLTFAGGNAFFFTDFNYEELDSYKAFDESTGSNFYRLGSTGGLSPKLGNADSIYISALTGMLEAPSVQPDVLIGPSGNRLTGDGVYSPGGGGQAVSIREKSKRLSGKFFADVENDGNAEGVFSIRGKGGSRKDKVKYSHSGSNVTAAVKRGYDVVVLPGQKADFVVKFARKGGRKFKENFRFSAAFGANVDTGVVKVRLKAPKQSSGLKPEDLN